MIFISTLQLVIVTETQQRQRSDPYQENINLGSLDGTKLYKTATEALPDGKKIEIILKNAHLLLRQLINDANRFGWEDLFFGIPKDRNVGFFCLDTDSHFH